MIEKLRLSEAGADVCLNRNAHETLSEYLKIDTTDCKYIHEIAEEFYSHHGGCTVQLVRALLCTKGLGCLVSSLFPPSKLV